MYPRVLKERVIFFIGFLIGFTVTIFLASINNGCDNNETECTYKSHELYDNGYRSSFRSEKWIVRGIKVSNENKYIKYNDNQEDVKFVEDIEQIKYEKWLEENNLIITPINIDTEHYRITDDNNNNKNNNISDDVNESTTTLESNWLKNQINIICIVSVDDARLARAIKNTWSNRCNKVYFFTNKKLNATDVPVVKLSLNITSSWQLLCEVMHQVWTESKETMEWVIFVRDNTMVLPENLRYLVAPLDHNDDYYLGHPIVWWGQTYNVAQAGYALSRGAFKKISEKFDSHEKCRVGGKFWRKDDYYLGKHLAGLNIHPIDTRDYKLRGVFHGYSLQTLLWNVAKISNYFTRALYPTGSFCCSPRSITFNIDEPDKMHTTNYLLYHLYVYNVENCYGNKPAPTPVPEQEIWKLTLKEEFNITDVTNITAERYYAIWRLKYSLPSQFIHPQIYKNISRISNSALTSFKTDIHSVMP